MRKPDADYLAMDTMLMYRNALVLMCFRAHDEDGTGVPVELFEGSERYDMLLLMARQAGWVQVIDGVCYITRKGIAWWREQVEAWSTTRSATASPKGIDVLHRYTPDGRRKGA